MSKWPSDGAYSLTHLLVYLQSKNLNEVQRVDLSQGEGIAVLEVETGVLKINTLHPFVAHFLDEYEDKKTHLPLELLAMSEILMEAHLYQAGLESSTIQDVLERRDQVLRFLARSTGKRNALMVAQALIEAANDKAQLEKELVAAFDSMGFAAVPKGGSGKPDGIADARLAATPDGQSRRYRVSLEAKSKEKPGTKVSAKSVGVSAIARQRSDFNCDHAIVVGPDFPTTKAEMSALVKEIKADKKATGKTITLVRIVDFARLVRLVPLKRLNQERLRSLFTTCETPEESKAWVEQIANEKPAKPPYSEILDTIWTLQDEVPNEAVEYAAVTTALRGRSPSIKVAKADLVELCKALSRMAADYVFTHQNGVELSQRPDKILEAMGAAIQQYPADERKWAK